MSSLPLPSAIVPGEAEEAALAEYAAVCRAAKTQLRAVWADLELGEGAVKAELERIVARAHEVWSEAVNQAKQRQNDLGLQIDEAWRESRSIQEELGQAPNAADGISSHPLDLVDDTPAGSMLTTNARYQRAARELEFWRGRKAERVEAMKGLRAEILRMHELLGKTDDTRSTGNLGISDDDLQSMKAEIESLRVEQLQRRRELAQAMMRLDAACDEVGEDCRRYAAAVHPSLEEFRHSASLNGQEPSSTPSSLDDVNLTDSTFRSLERKIEAVYAIKAEREAKVAELACKLAVLWDNLQMPEGDVDREIIVKLLGSSERLHPSTLDQCQEELERLEVKKARKTCHTIRVKHEELLKLAADAHMEDPGMGPLVGSLHKGPQGDGPMVYVRKVEEAHARVLQCIEATKAAAVKRGGVLAKISEIQGAVSEVEWLREYEQDSNRFKGRDSTRNLQRSIKAEKVRAQLPGLLQGTIQALNDWEDVEGEEFMYDGVSYKAHLVALKEEAEHALQSKGLHGKVSRSASAGRPTQKPSAAPSTPSSSGASAPRRMSAAGMKRPQGHPPPASRAASAAGPRKSLSSCKAEPMPNKPKPEAPSACRDSAGSNVPELDVLEQPKQAAAHVSSRIPRKGESDGKSSSGSPTDSHRCAALQTALQEVRVDCNSPHALVSPASSIPTPKNLHRVRDHESENCPPSMRTGKQQQAKTPSGDCVKKSLLKQPSTYRSVCS